MTGFTTTPVNHGAVEGDGTGEGAFTAFEKLNASIANIILKALDTDSVQVITAVKDFTDEIKTHGIAIQNNNGLYCQDGSAGSIYMAGGDSNTDGGGVAMYGSTHATKASDIELFSPSFSGANRRAIYDYSADTWYLIGTVDHNDTTKLNGVTYFDNNDLTVDDVFYAGNNGATLPAIYFDSGSYVEYDRGTGQFNFVVDNVTQASVSDEGIIYPPATGITAYAGGGQANAVELTAQRNVVATVATTADSVKLPTAVAGQERTIFNEGANACNVFPSSSDNLGAGVDTAASLAAGANITYYAIDATNWRAVT